MRKENINVADVTDKFKQTVVKIILKTYIEVDKLFFIHYAQEKKDSISEDKIKELGKEVQNKIVTLCQVQVKEEKESLLYKGALFLFEQLVTTLPMVDKMTPTQRRGQEIFEKAKKLLPSFVTAEIITSDDSKAITESFTEGKEEKDVGKKKKVVVKKEGNVYCSRFNNEKHAAVYMVMEYKLEQLFQNPDVFKLIELLSLFDRFNLKLNLRSKENMGEIKKNLLPPDRKELATSFYTRWKTVFQCTAAYQFGEILEDQYDNQNRMTHYSQVSPPTQESRGKKASALAKYNLSQDLREKSRPLESAHVNQSAKIAEYFRSKHPLLTITTLYDFLILIIDTYPWVINFVTPYILHAHVHNHPLVIDFILFLLRTPFIEYIRQCFPTAGNAWENHLLPEYYFHYRDLNDEYRWEIRCNRGYDVYPYASFELGSLPTETEMPKKTLESLGLPPTLRTMLDMINQLPTKIKEAHRLDQDQKSTSLLDRRSSKTSSDSRKTSLSKTEPEDRELSSSLAGSSSETRSDSRETGLESEDLFLLPEGSESASSSAGSSSGTPSDLSGGSTASSLSSTSTFNFLVPSLFYDDLETLNPSNSSRPSSSSSSRSSQVGSTSLFPSSPTPLSGGLTSTLQNRLGVLDEHIRNLEEIKDTDQSILNINKLTACIDFLKQNKKAQLSSMFFINSMFPATGLENNSESKLISELPRPMARPDSVKTSLTLSGLGLIGPDSPQPLQPAIDSTVGSSSSKKEIKPETQSSLPALKKQASSSSSSSSSQGSISLFSSSRQSTQSSASSSITARGQA